MGSTLLRIGLWFALASRSIEARDLFVAPNGTPSGPGTIPQPYDLVTALSGQVSQPGDTFWFRGGNYSLGHLNTSVQGAPGSPVTFRGVTGENARIDGSMSIFNSVGYLVFRDFELYSSDANRVSSQTNAGFNVTDIAILPGFACYAPNLSFINLVIHDQTRHGIYLYEGATNSLVYGCLVFNNGWVSPDNAEGHGFYVEANVGTRSLAHNIVFNNSGVNFHLYENNAGLSLQGIILDGNVAFGAGSIQHIRQYIDWLVGADPPGVSADDVVLGNNMGYLPPGEPALPYVQIGRFGTNGDVVITNNYMPLGLAMTNWTTATVTGNLFAPWLTNYVVNLKQSAVALDADWDDNIYVFDPPGPSVSLNAQLYTFSEWQDATGYDANSTFVTGDLHGTRVFVSPNEYQQGRANVVVYNWDSASNVAVDVSSVLSLNSRFVVLNAQDPLAPPVLSGIYSGQRLSLPMTNLTVAQVNGPANGPLAAPPPTGPRFNVFLLLQQPNPIQIQRQGNSVLISWEIGAGANALQVSQNPFNPNSWVYPTASPVVVGDEYVISDTPNASQMFYRLSPH